MSDNEIVTICQQQFPQAEIIIFTGSQVGKELIDKNVDLDILIVDARFSIVSSKMYVWQEIKFDFTIVPLNDLDNVINNEKFDPSGILFTMIKSGKILFQRNSLGDLLKGKVEQNTVQVSSLAPSRRNSIVNDLIKMKRVFNGNLNSRESFLAMNLFISLITDAEIARISNWNFANKQKVKFLEKNSPGFIDELIAITNNINYGLNKNDLSHLSAYADYYDNNSKISIDSKNESGYFERYLIDIGLSTLTCENLIEVYDVITNDTELQNCFLYFFSSPTKYHRLFKNRFSLVFALKKGLQKKEIYFRVLKIFNEHFSQQSAISLNANYIFSNLSNNSYLWFDFENVAIQLNMLLNNEVNNLGKFDPERIIYISIIIFGFVANKLDLNIDEMLKVNGYMQARWMFNKEEQYGTDLANLNLLSLQKLKKFNDYFNNKHLSIIASFKKGLSNDLLEDVNKSYHECLKEIQNYILHQQKKPDILLNNNFFIDLIFQSKYEIKSTTAVIIYMQLVEQILCCLDMNNIQSGLIIHLLSESIKYIKIEKYKNPQQLLKN